ncbi:hypothetical protein K439DRAFT_1023450 [Ramaria rubella]|nr:hypothetical protein K439DRAFT_1023450 [Ramaria rubella]
MFQSAVTPPTFSWIPNTAFRDSNHVLHDLPLPPIEKWLECLTFDKPMFKCCWKGCPEKPFASRARARDHVHKHLRVKCIECTCGVKFSSRNTAKRHRDTRVKSFSCEVCGREFARRDYRNVHQRHCASKLQH